MEAFIMIRIAIVEDEKQSSDLLCQMISRYASETETDMETVAYPSAVAFLTNYQASFDIVFMDIEMPYLNGMEGAAKLREIDHTTLLIFATNLGQMAAMGYSVEAFDFIVKPISYEILRDKLKRAVLRLKQNRINNVSFKSRGAIITLPSSEIRYLEVRNHQMIIHADSGDYPVYGAMSGMCRQLEPLGFSLCNSCYLVNLRFVRKVEKYSVTVGADVLQISHPRKKAFLQALNDYIGG